MARKSPSPKGDGAAGKDRLLDWYRDMLLIRRFEERAGQLYGMGLIGGFCHLYIGQEAVAVGIEAVRRQRDETKWRAKALPPRVMARPAKTGCLTGTETCCSSAASRSGRASSTAWG